MKSKLLILGIATTFALVGCNTNHDNNQESMDNNGTVDETRDNVNNTRDNGTDNNQVKGVNETKYEVSKEAADRITSDVKGIKRASVLTTDNNAYVAAQLDEPSSAKSGDELTDDTKKRIKEVVRDVDSNIENVYVTTNPDFANLVEDYRKDADAGKPIGGFFDQIGNMIERVFPQNK